MYYKRLFLILLVSSMAGCGGDLNSLAAPEEGMVSGLVCSDLPLLLAATDPTVKQALIQDGKCVKIRSYMAQKVKFVRTVMMPGDGKYSQFELEVKNKIQKMWIPTIRVQQSA